MSKDPDVFTRIHPTLASRKEQIHLNQLAVEGGKPYINARLHRYPSESDTSWKGDGNQDVVGRKDRAYNINYPRRITSKLNQYVFGQTINRSSDSEFIDDVTNQGHSANEFMADVNEMATAQGWCWVSVDRGALPVDEEGNPIPRTAAEREAAKDRPYWCLWSPEQVVDWQYDRGTGDLLWLITETTYYESATPDQPRKEIRERTVWNKGGTITRYTKTEGEKEAEWSEQELSYAGGRIPFFMVGNASPRAYWFDEVEILQAAILNLMSSDHETLGQAVFPQLVLPKGLVEWAMGQADMTYQQTVETARGLNYPLFEDKDDKGISRFLMPDGTDCETIGKKIEKLKQEMFEVVGLQMADKGSKQKQSAESKRWDHMDPESTLKDLSHRLANAERKLVEFSKQLDTEFKEWEPEYPQSFDVEDPTELVEAITGIGALSLPAEAEKEVQKAGLRVLASLVTISDDRMKEIEDAIDNYDGLDEISGGGFPREPQPLPTQAAE